jgi:phosphoglycolate phosphatase-like HAD superfamily hydrolase
LRRRAGSTASSTPTPSRTANPPPDLFEEALRKAEVYADGVVAVGDAVWEVQSAKGAGIRAVALLSDGAFDEEDLRESGAIEVHKDCAALFKAGFPV